MNDANSTAAVQMTRRCYDEGTLRRRDLVIRQCLYDAQPIAVSFLESTFRRMTANSSFRKSQIKRYLKDYSCIANHTKQNYF